MPVALALIPAALGVAQAVGGAIKAGKERRAINALKPPPVTQNKAISDYYQAALNRFNTSPYNSTFYQQQQKGINTSFGAGIHALSDRRLDAGNVGALVAQRDASLEKAGAAAENMQNQRFAQLGQASQMKLADQRFMYQRNAVAPYEQQQQLNYAQLGAANSLISAGISNIGEGAQTASLMALRQKNPYGSGGYGMNYI